MRVLYGRLRPIIRADLRVTPEQRAARDRDAEIRDRCEAEKRQTTAAERVWRHRARKKGLLPPRQDFIALNRLANKWRAFQSAWDRAPPEHKTELFDGALAELMAKVDCRPASIRGRGKGYR